MTLKDGLQLFTAIIICNLSGIIGSVFTAPSIPTWYAMLEKPALNPPSWVFGPVWTTLYTLMGVSVWVIWKLYNEKKGKQLKTALAVFTIQLILNALWSPIFFGVQNLALAFVVIILMWLAILATIVLFYRQSKAAGLLLVPYIAWVSFAAYLNYSIWMLN